MTKNKTRYFNVNKLPCENYIRDGCCTYEKCNFIHDKRLCLNSNDKEFNKKKIKKNKENIYHKDVFFYPPDSEDTINKTTYNPCNKNKPKRLKVFQHLSTGKSINEYDYLKENFTDEKNNNIKTLNLYTSGSSFYLNLIKFIESS